LETEEEDTNGLSTRNINETIDDEQDINSRKIKDNNDNFDDSNYYDDNNFTDIKYITHGAYGDINSAYSKKDKIYLCLKHININQMREDYEKKRFTKSYENDLNNEIKLLKIFSSFENSLKYYGSYDKKNGKIIVLEKCDEDLQLFMEKRNKSLEIEKIKEILTKLNILFKEMHKRNIIHRDLKLKNFLVKYKNNKEDFIVKLGDYGIGKLLNIDNKASGFKGTNETAAPKTILEKIESYENSVDIFSLGVILYQLSHNLRHPFHKNKAIMLSIYVNKFEEDNFKIEFDNSIKNKNFKDLLERMLKLNPKNRLNWTQYFKHPFF